jgi:hypothetical protein
MVRYPVSKTAQISQPDMDGELSPFASPHHALVIKPKVENRTKRATPVVGRPGVIHC